MRPWEEILQAIGFWALDIAAWDMLATEDDGDTVFFLMLPLLVSGSALAPSLSPFSLSCSMVVAAGLGSGKSRTQYGGRDSWLLVVQCEDQFTDSER